MSSNYPPGVTGNEWEIAGYPPCGGCGHDDTDHYSDDEPESGCAIDRCPCAIYTPYPEEEDPDYLYDRMRDDRMLNERGG